jgi:hypothetical protein
MTIIIEPPVTKTGAPFVTERHKSAARFLALVDKSPTDFFQILGQQETENRRIWRRSFIAWKVIIIPTIIAGYAAALLLLRPAFLGLRLPGTPVRDNFRLKPAAIWGMPRNR